MIYADAVRQMDNRDMQEMERLHVSRIEALQRRIAKLENDLEYANRQLLNAEAIIEDLRRGFGEYFINANL